MKHSIRLRTLIFTCIVSVLFSLQQPLKACAKEELQLYATYAAIIDSETGRVLYEKDGEKQVPMASTTKILTCILALEQGNMEDVVTVSSEAAKMPPVKMGMLKGEQYYLKDLLYALMLESYNDVAVAIAEHISGSVEEFAKQMNEKARNIGCKRFNFITPNGLDAVQKNNKKEKCHSISAIDLAKIMSYCCTKSTQREAFLEITRQRNYSFSSIKGTKSQRTFQVNNYNQLLSNSLVQSGKTGFTAKAGYCYVSQVKVEDKPVSIALLACGWPNHKNYKWQDMNKIIQFLSKNLISTKFHVPKELPFIKLIDSQHHIGKSNLLYRKVQLKDMPKRKGCLCLQNERIKIKIKVEKSVSLPSIKNQVVGKVMWMCKDKIVYEEDLVLKDSYYKNSFQNCFEECLAFFVNN